MSTNHTEHFNLCQWEPTDQILRADFNEDNQKIDAALAEASKGNCRIVAGSYVGTGEWGEEHPNSLTFAFPPQMVILGINLALESGNVPKYFLLFPTCPYFQSASGSGRNNVTWSGNSISWYCPASFSDQDKPGMQFNREGDTYHYLAIG